MAEVVCQVESVAEATSGLQVDWATVVVSAANATSTADPDNRGIGAESTGDAASSVDGSIARYLQSAAVASSTVSASASKTEALAARGQASDAVALAVSASLTSTAEAASSVDTDVPIDLVSRAAAASAVDSLRVVTVEVESRAVASSGFGHFVAVSVVSEAAAASNITGQASPALVSTAQASSSVAAVVSRTVQCESVAEAASAIAASLVAVTQVESTAVARSSAQLPNPVAPAFWTNTETLSAATWAAVPYDSFAFVRGKLYAVGEGGLFAMDAETDAGAPIAARVRGDNSDFGASQRKRVAGAYSGGWMEAPMKWTVATEQGEWSYTTRKPNFEMPTNYRVTFGKGLASRYMRFQIENVDGADFDIKDHELMAAAGSRRIGG